jgi:hypothetical protein
MPKQDADNRLDLQLFAKDADGQKGQDQKDQDSGDTKDKDQLDKTDKKDDKKDSKPDDKADDKTISADDYQKLDDQVKKLQSNFDKVNTDKQKLLEEVENLKKDKMTKDQKEEYERQKLEEKETLVAQKEKRLDDVSFISQKEGFDLAGMTPSQIYNGLTDESIEERVKFLDDYVQRRIKKHTTDVLIGDGDKPKGGDKGPEMSEAEFNKMTVKERSDFLEKHPDLEAKWLGRK